MAHDTHVGAVMRGLSSPELAGWIEYFRLKDEIQQNRLVFAIRRAFNGDKAQQQQQKPQEDDEDEDVIDTTDPKFAEQFKGFINKPAQPPVQPSSRMQQQSTQIILG